MYVFEHMYAALERACADLPVTLLAAIIVQSFEVDRCVGKKDDRGAVVGERYNSNPSNQNTQIYNVYTRQKDRPPLVGHSAPPVPPKPDNPDTACTAFFFFPFEKVLLCTLAFAAFPFLGGVDVLEVRGGGRPGGG